MLGSFIAGVIFSIVAGNVYLFIAKSGLKKQQCDLCERPCGIVCSTMDVDTYEQRFAKLCIPCFAYFEVCRLPPWSKERPQCDCGSFSNVRPCASCKKYVCGIHRIGFEAHYCSIQCASNDGKLSP